MKNERQGEILGRNTWRPLITYIDEPVLDALGLPKYEPTKSMTFNGNGQPPVEVHFYVGKQNIEPVKSYKRGLPVIIFKRGDGHQIWYLNCIEGTHPQYCKTDEQEDFFDRAKKIMKPENEHCPYGFQFRVPELAKNIKR